MRRREMAAGLVSLAAAPRASFAQAQYDPGASDAEIKLGQTMPYSGPVSAAATVGYACTAYFETVNKTGGINGRKVTLVSLDDGYSPPKTVELTRRLVEGDKVLFVYGSVGTPTNAAVQKFLNSRKIPQLFVTTGGSRFNNPAEYPWTIPVLPSHFAEGKALARFVLETVWQQADQLVIADRRQFNPAARRSDANGDTVVRHGIDPLVTRECRIVHMSARRRPVANILVLVPARLDVSTAEHGRK
jgi:ABC-type branched-subunit amino acid transport system substrate-binding protein